MGGLPKPDMYSLLDEYIFSLGYELYETPDADSFTSTTKFKVICKHNSDHIFTTNISMLRCGRLDITEDCPHCKKPKRYAKMQLSYESIETWLKDNNLELLNKKSHYSRNQDVLKLKCKLCSTEKEIKSISNFEKKTLSKNIPYVCEGCENKKAEIRRLEQEREMQEHSSNTVYLPSTIFNKEPTQTILDKIENIDTTWHILEYNGTRTKSKVMCRKCGFKKDTKIFNIFTEKGRNCLNCFKMKQKDSVDDKILSICNEFNLTVMMESIDSKIYETIDTPMRFSCNNCSRVIEKSWAEITGLYYILNCPSCKPKSKKQNSIEDFIRTILPNSMTLQTNDRGVISPLELDFYIPEINLAIEFGGNIWHSSKFIDRTTYHEEKTDRCYEKGIQLLTIFEDEWDDKQEVCKSIIKNKILGSENKVYARDCEVFQLEDSDNIRCFFNENHIQGATKQIQVCYGLFHKNELVQVMSFVETRQSQHEDYELNRLCSRKDHIIIGGASKLLKQFLKSHRGKSICSFADRRFSEGKVYERIGFNEKYRIRPRYTYVGAQTNWKRKHRFGFNKKKLVEKYGSQYQHMSEKEITESLGLFRLYDCGSIKYVIEREDNHA